MGNDTVKRGKKKSAHKQTDRRTHTSQSCGPWKTREMVASDCVCARAREREREREKRERDRQREREKEREREREREREVTCNEHQRNSCQPRSSGTSASCA